MNNNYTHVVLLLDASGSMIPLADQSRKCISSFIREQKTLPGECTVSIYKFAGSLHAFHGDDSYDLNVINLADTANVIKVLHGWYTPQGFTALYDAACKAIDSTGTWLSNMSEDRRPANVVFVILTDGEDNSSVTYSHDDLASRIKHQTEKYNWNFIYLGVGIDSFRSLKSAAKFIAADCTFSAGATQYGVQQIYASLGSTISSIRGGKDTNGIAAAYTVTPKTIARDSRGRFIAKTR